MTVPPPTATLKPFAIRLLVSLSVFICWDSLLIVNGASLNSLNAELPNSSRTFLESLNKRRCPPLPDSLTLTINAESTKIITNDRVRRRSSVCRHIGQCDVTSSPPETQVSWFSIDADGNERLIYSKSQRDLTLDLLAKRNPEHSERIIGISGTVYRVCLDPYMQKPNEPYKFKCRVKSVCDDRLEEESEVMTVPIKGRWLNSPRPMPRQQAPLITMITSSRLEYAGQFVQMFCHATGSPRPQIQWEVIDELNERKFYPVEAYPFIKVLDTNDIMIDTRRLRDTVTLSLQCKASNSIGNVAATSTLLLLEKDEEK